MSQPASPLPRCRRGGASIPQTPSDKRSRFGLRLVSIVITPILCLLPACATWPRIVEKSIATSDKSHPPVTVPGLREAVERAAARGGSVHLFLVHGMSNHPFGGEASFPTEFQAKDYTDILAKLRSNDWREEPVRRGRFIAAIRKAQFDPLVPRLVSRLGLDYVANSSELEWYEDGKGLLGYKLREVFEGKSTGGKSPRRLVVHLSAWAPVSIAEKIPLMARDNYQERNDFPLNRSIKDGTVSWGLADAAQYVGKNRSRIQYAVALGLESMAKEAGIDSSSANPGVCRDLFAFGAASLGSIITLDALATLAGNGGKQCYLDGGRNTCVNLDSTVVQAMFSGGLPLYLFANQIPLLWPAIEGKYKTKGEARALANQIAEFAPAAKQHRFLVVAFNDPADFLGYRVPNLDTGKGVGIDVINVMTRNQGYGIWWLVNSPLDAHTGFPKTRAVMDFMAEGGKVTKTADTGGFSTGRSAAASPVTTSQPIASYQ